jgi:hypothetical protein
METNTPKNNDTSLIERQKQKTTPLMPAVTSCQHLGEFFIPPGIHLISPLLNFAMALLVLREKVALFSFLSSSCMAKV